MLQKIGDAAEGMALYASRRAFLGRLGQGAMVATCALGGFLASASRTLAARNSSCPPGTHHSRCHGGTVLCCPHGTQCVGVRGNIYCG